MINLAVSECDDYRSAFQEELVESFQNDRLHLILLPTEQCNFRCTYCYEDFLIGRMQPETIRGVKRLIDRRLDDLRLLNISWFGGEPMLATGVIEEISRHIVDAAKERPSLRYYADMTTNGYLLNTDAVARLHGLGVRSFQISLDGPELLHDSTRVRASGKGSFRQIWGNLLSIRDSAAGVNVLLRVHLTPDNLPFMPKFLRTLRDTFLVDPRFQVTLKPVEHMGGPNDDTIEIIQEEDRHTTIAELEAIVTDGTGKDRLYEGSDVCYASRPNSLMIRANGRVGKCTVALTDVANTIGELLPDGSLRIDNSRLQPWLRGWQSRDLEDLGCPLATMPRDSIEFVQIARVARSSV